MKSTLIAALALGLLSSSALAADPVMETAFDWTGLYAGVNGGFGFGGDDDVGIFVSNGVVLPKVGELDLSGPFGGAQVGYNFQADRFVFGVEGDIQFGNIDDRFSSVTSDGYFTRGSSEIDFFGTARVRGGWAFDRLLVYGTGGLAWANVDYDVAITDDGSGNHVNMSSDKVQLGYAIGGGAEYAIDEAWTVKAEYLYVNLGHDDISGRVLDAGGTPNSLTAHTRATPSFHVARVGVNWKF